jgi:hypothetical protein
LDIKFWEIKFSKHGAVIPMAQEIKIEIFCTVEYANRV